METSPTKGFFSRLVQALYFVQDVVILLLFWIQNGNIEPKRLSEVTHVKHFLDFFPPFPTPPLSLKKKKYIYIYIYLSIEFCARMYYMYLSIEFCLLFQFLLAIISFCLITNPGVLCSLFYVIFSFNTPKRFQSVRFEKVILTSSLFTMFFFNFSSKKKKQASMTKATEDPTSI